ncbi:ABC transporter ATP-binding protein [Roseobacter cerasinus]|uniref:ABC transporter ATP-binding protein n=1 Tax=Roseobacter cerasinus TaxID=2602289 RepID=A0A640VRF6_9RHOB|nr:dipeptide ABC transporter ATP-binding protein [Roseobacter cerasinus]GFE49475.1 ABC transporter ATP-binding protein [Roseobacter cerasinus]
MSLLHIDNLSLWIGEADILKSVSLRVNPGEILAITGESGSGKSMTALAIMQLLPRAARTSGSIRLDGAELTTLPERDLCALRGNDIGMIFQEPMTALNPVHSIGRQVAETIRLHAPSADADTQMRDILTRVGLPPDRVPPNRYPHELSGGQRQRVVIAMAIALRPKLLIADEPTTALDVTTQAQILTLLKELVRDFGMGLILITHDLAVVADTADRIAIMRDGEIVETGRTHHMLQTRQHPYTRMLFKASTHQVKLPKPPPPTALLDVQHLQCSYRLPRPRPFARPGQFDAVKDVSFTLMHGERLGLVGESGCGKSTLTRALLGLEAPSRGQILLDGTPVTTQGKANLKIRRRMQVVFQDPFGSFNPRHRVARLITEPFHLLDSPPRGPIRRDVMADALTAVGLKPEDASRYIHEFSGGQRQRLAIARALIIKPDLIIFDEAVSALDVSVRAQILDLIADLCRTHGLTYLFISHDLGVVRSVTDRVLVMQAGEIVEQGQTDAVFTKPQHPYTKKLIAAVPKLPDLRMQPLDGDRI